MKYTSGRFWSFVAAGLILALVTLVAIIDGFSPAIMFGAGVVIGLPFGAYINEV